MVLRSRLAPTHQSALFSLMCVEQEIKTHTQRVESGELVFYGKACPACGSQEAFRLHDRRRRSFRVVVDGCVKRLCSWILRWRCQACGKRFTDTPPFCRPAQAVFQAACAGEIQRISERGNVLSPGGPAPGSAHSVRRPGAIQYAGRKGSRCWFGAEYRLAMVVVVGEAAERCAGSWRACSAESARQCAAPRSVADLATEVSQRRTPADASGCSAGPGDRSLVPGTAQRGNVPQLCNGSRLELT